MLLNLDESWYQEEEREGFVVSEEMKRCWAETMEVLLQVDKICKDYGLHYFAGYGTLLGAVRHKGYIPWDDDMDIQMLRQDFERFRKIAGELLPEGYYVRHWGTAEGSDSVIMRVMNGTDIRFSDEYLKEHHRCPYPVGVDIFAVDWLPESDEEYQMQINILRLINAVDIEWQKDSVFPYSKRREDLNILEDSLKVKLDESQDMETQCAKLTDAVSAMYGPGDGGYLGVPADRLLTTQDQRLPKEWYSQVIMQPFEMIEMPIPIGYHEILTHFFNEDYATPVHYTNHGYPYFKDMRERMENFFAENGVTRKDILGY